MRRSYLRRTKGLESKVRECKEEGCSRVVGSFGGGYCVYHGRGRSRVDRYGGYYGYHMDRLKGSPYSELSGKYIGDVGRVNVCHLIDKGRHPSVGGELENYIYLTWREHQELDRHLFENDFEWFYGEYGVIWDRVMERLLYLLPRVKERTRYIERLEEFLEGIK